MSRRRKLFVAVACGLVACVAVALFTRDNEPTYRGRKLSEWVAQYAEGGSEVPPLPGKPPAAEAIRHIGDAALPSLFAWLDWEPGYWRLKLDHGLRQLPQGISDKIPEQVDDWFISHIAPGTKMELKSRSAYGFIALGDKAAPAIPELARRVTTGHPIRRGLAVKALSGLGPVAKPAVPELRKALNDPVDLIRIAATNALQNIAPEVLTDAPAR